MGDKNYQQMINTAQDEARTGVAATDGNTSNANETPATPVVAEPTVTTPVAETTPVTEPVVTEPKAEVTPVVTEPAKEPTQTTTETPGVTVVRKEKTTTQPTPEVSHEGYLSLADVEKQKVEWQEANKPKETFFDERSAAIDAHLRTGGELDATFWKYQNNDLDKIDLSNTDVNTAINLIKQELTDVQSYSDAEADLFIKRKYPDLYRGVDDEDDDGLERLNDDKTQVGMDVRKSLDSMKQFKEKVKLPDATTVGPSAEDIALQEEAVRKYSTEATQAVSAFTKFDVDVNEDVRLEMLVGAEQTESLTQLISNPANLDAYFFNEYVDNGKTDFSRMASDLHFMKNRESIIKSIVTQAIAIGKEEALKASGKEPTLSKGAQVVPGGGSNNDAGNSWLKQLNN